MSKRVHSIGQGPSCESPDPYSGSSVIGASIWDSHNHWLTIHGTDYLVVRDCVGYQSVGHGFFLEDATEQYNVLDRNLAVQANQGKRLPKQVLDYVSLKVKRDHGVSYYFHDYPARGRTTRVVSTYFPELMKGGTYRSIGDFTGARVRAADVTAIKFPVLLDPVDDLPPATVITHVRRAPRKLIVRGVTSDNGTVKRVLVNGVPARAVRENFAEWEVVLDEPRGREMKLTAHAEDVAGNVEKRTHERWVP